VTWFKVDDTFWSHPKVIMLPPRAVSLWVRAGAWSAAHGQDGFVPVKAVRLCGTLGAAHELVEAGLWEETVGADDTLAGFTFHDWADYQPSAEEVDERRRRQRERKAEWRKKRDMSRGTTTSPPDGNGRVTPLYPTRPDPTKGRGSGRSEHSPTPTPPSAREALAAIEAAHQRDQQQEQP